MKIYIKKCTSEILCSFRRLLRSICKTDCLNNDEKFLLKKEIRIHVKNIKCFNTCEYNFFIYFYLNSVLPDAVELGW